MATNNYPHSIPTPPFSPRLLPAPDVDNPLKSTINLLDSLVAFYQHERMWVYRTRAVLEEAFEAPHISSTANSDSQQQEQNSLPSPSGSSTSSEPASTLPETDDTDNTPPARSGQMPSRWMRRKKGFKLRLEGIAPKAKRAASSRPLKRDQRDQDVKEHILQLFEKMMEDRMESCQRVNKLVRNANRAYLHSR